MAARGAKREWTWDRLARLRRLRRVQSAATVGVVILGPFLAVATYLILGPLNQGAASSALRLILLADFVYVLAVAALVMSGVARMIAARRAMSAGSRLHMRLTGVFAIIALIPTVLVAIFAVLTVNVGLEGWFSDRVSRVVGNSLEAAQAYEEEHRSGLVEDAESLAAYLNLSKEANRFLTDAQLRQALQQAQSQIQRGLREAFVIDGDGEIRVRGDRSYLFDYEEPSADDLARAMEGETVVIEDWDINEFRALVRMGSFPDHLLYVSRSVDGEVLSLLDETQETVMFYQQLENQRGRVLFEFGLIYLGFAAILILAATWLGMWFAERLSRPVGRLAGAAQRVGEGDLDVQVIEEDGDDEIATLGRQFNAMTRQLKAQRDTLVASADQIETRRRLFDSVLSSVTAGVVGLDAEGKVTFLNRAAARLLDLAGPDPSHVPLSLLVPEFGPLFDRLRNEARSQVQEELGLTRMGKAERLLVRIARRYSDEGELEGFVIAFDDVTDLVSAQRMAAWGDVARRIAHEIKNPLTPIALSAERINRKYGRMMEGENAEKLEELTGTIVRQTDILRRIVDEFSKFARMPEPEKKPTDLAKLLRDAVVLQEAGQEAVTFAADIPAGALPAELDESMIGQAFTNLIKNAGEAIETLQEKGAPDGHSPEIRVALTIEGEQARITIADNGVGLPADRARLFEPYVTTRDKGTGLGLPIVKKIIEEHGGTLALTDAPDFGSGQVGAMAVITLPLPAAAGVSRAAE
ncbi:PAS domain-containing sensor histidine kinase [Maritimibacter sp. UBA3975]|uniref:sensor histidine kinase NtrY-like n=1 Tax=Maritimibacter sp. UBA3975 TaxID=1946833 RepID=UPI000C095027|nr:PAS domain-containing sensor histidine kinase [Maritimibacter sp. UBA3975]MAM60168.1 PAS domain-containing sensor histidine kinase [Maritimibacter sp.]|tara:strand:+ start:11423 stop:13678 length:2256 start_codon:yes stop_codon:yes gene_type:complete